MLRHAARSAIKRRGLLTGQQQAVGRTFATQSGDDAKKPTALAKLHLEDGTTLIGKSFGSHEAAEGEVSDRWSHLLRSVYIVFLDQGKEEYTGAHLSILIFLFSKTGRLRHRYGWIP